RAASRHRMPTAAFGHIAEAARDRKSGVCRWSTLTDRAPRAPAARRGGGQGLAPRQAFRPEAGGLQAYLRGYSSNNTKSCPLIPRAFALSISGAKSLRAALKR